MIKRTLYFGNPAYLKTRNGQLLIEQPDKEESKEVPIEDIGFILLDHQQITLTQGLIARLMENNVALISCDATHHPDGLMLPIEGHTLQSARYRVQAEASVPLKKQLWQQTVSAKIENQAAVLRFYGLPHAFLTELSRNVKSGDSDNAEATAAVYYWKHLFSSIPGFVRERFGPEPNNLLNYGYAILRAVTARSLVSSGLMPTLGIFHRSQYNAYCLADDIMEPYRPFVDMLIYPMVQTQPDMLELNPGIKRALLGVPAMDVYIQQEKSPLMNAMQRTTTSLARCFEGKQRKMLYPQLMV